MKVQIFDVEHGGCSLITTDNGKRILVDCGHNSSTGWRPSSYLANMGVKEIEKLVITNYDEDHASDLPNLLNTVYVRQLHSNPSVSGSDLKKLKHSGGIGKGIEALADMKGRYTSGISTEIDFGETSMQSFWNSYPTDFDDENNLSMVVIIKAHGLTICFPGDIEVPGWKKLLESYSFRNAIKDVSIFVASHHGRENGCCSELFTETGLNPYLFVISDSGVQYASQETVAWYRSRAKGASLNGENRHVLTTRRDGRILITASPGSTTVALHN